MTHATLVEERYSRERSRLNWLLKGDANTAFFHAIENGRRRKCAITRFVSDQGVLMEQADLEGHIYSFYKELMGVSSEPKWFGLSQDIWIASGCVSMEENEAIMMTVTS